MGLAITTIGLKISYAIEAVAGTRPTTNYIHIPDLKEFPDLDSEPQTADATTFDNLVYTSYVTLLKDLGGALTITGNMTQELKDVWQTMYSNYSTAIKEGKRTWFAVDIPGINEAAYMTTIPSPLGVSALSANSLAEQNLYITPTGEPIWDSKPTYQEVTQG